MYQNGFDFNNQQRLICHKKTNQTKPNIRSGHKSLRYCRITEKDHKRWCIKIYSASLLFLLLPKMFGRIKVRMSRRRLRLHTEGWTVRIFSETSLLFFFSVPYLCETGIELRQISNHLSFSSLLNSWQSGARPEPRVMSCLAAAFQCLLFSACFFGLCNILDSDANSCSQTPSLPTMRCMWTCLLLACHQHNLQGISAGETPATCLV